MKLRLSPLVLLLMLCSSALQAQQRSFLIIWQDTLFGLIDTEGRPVLPCQYQDIDISSLPYICVKQDNRWGVVDSEGNTLIPSRYPNCPEVIPTPYFLIHNGAEGYSVVDRSDSVILTFPPECRRVYTRYDSWFWGTDYYSAPDEAILFAYTTGTTGKHNTANGIRYTANPPRAGLIAIDGHDWLLPLYKEISFWDKYIVITDTLDHQAILNYQGQAILPRSDIRYPDRILSATRMPLDNCSSQFQLDGNIWMGERYGMRIIDNSTGLQGLYADDGRELLPPIYRTIEDYYPYTYCLQDSMGMWALFDTSFHPLTPFRYRKIQIGGEMEYLDFFEARTPAGDLHILNHKGDLTVIDPTIPSDTLDFIFDYPFVKVDSVLRLIGPDGHLLPQRYHESSIYNEHFFGASLGKNQWGIINCRGRIVIPFQYESADVDYDGSIYARRTNGKVDVFDTNGHRHFSCYGIHNEGSHYLAYNRKGKMALVSKEGVRLSRYYSHIAPVIGSQYWKTVQTTPKDNTTLIGYIGPDGREILPCTLQFNEDLYNHSAYNQNLSEDCTCGELIYPYDLPYRKNKKKK